MTTAGMSVIEILEGQRGELTLRKLQAHLIRSKGKMSAHSLRLCPKTSRARSAQGSSALGDEICMEGGDHCGSRILMMCPISSCLVASP